MDIGIGESSFGTVGTLLAIGTAVQAQLDVAQLANADALFGSLGLGSSVNASA